MKKTKVQITALAAAAALLFGGCGTASYELSEQEEDIIVNYSAHIVSKYNTLQSGGLVYVDMETTEETEADAAKETETPPESTAEAGAPVEGTEAEAIQTAGLNELFGMDGVEVAYVGARLDPSYLENTYYAMDAGAGNTYLILGIDITNTSDAPIDVDYLSMMPAFQAVVNGTETSTSEFTVLTDDFSVFEGTLQAGETKETVLLFQVPETVEAVETVELTATLGGSSYQINL